MTGEWIWTQSLRGKMCVGRWGGILMPERKRGWRGSCGGGGQHPQGQLSCWRILDGVWPYTLYYGQVGTIWAWVMSGWNGLWCANVSILLDKPRALSRWKGMSARSSECGMSLITLQTSLPWHRKLASEKQDLCRCWNLLGGKFQVGASSSPAEAPGVGSREPRGLLWHMRGIFSGRITLTSILKLNKVRENRPLSLGQKSLLLVLLVSLVNLLNSKLPSISV